MHFDQTLSVPKWYSHLYAQTFPCYPTSSREGPDARGGERFKAGWSGESVGSGGPTGR
jgi:hypothetical protein